MADPVTGAAVSGVASAVGNRVIEKIITGEDDHQEWLQQVVETATEAEAARRYCIESTRNPQRSELEGSMGEFGKQARKLEVIGERQGYKTEEVNAVSEIAQICSTYAINSKGTSLDPEEELSDELPPIVEEVFTFVE